MTIEDHSEPIWRLRPERECDETVEGREAAVAQDTAATYAEMSKLHLNRSGMSDEDFEATMSDLSGRLIDLDTRRRELFVERTARYMERQDEWKNRHGDWPSTTEVVW